MKKCSWDETPEANDGADGSNLPVLCGITPETPGFENGVLDAVLKKAGKLAKGNPADVSVFATEIAADVFKARANWNPDKGKWKPFAGRAIKWAATHIKRDVIDPEREYRHLIPVSLDAKIKSDDPESDTFEATATEDAFSESRRFVHDPEGEELKRRLGKWIASLPGTPLVVVEVELRQRKLGKAAPAFDNPRALCEAYMSRWTTRQIEEAFGIPRSSIAVELKKLAKLLPPDFRELI